MTSFLSPTLGGQIGGSSDTPSTDTTALRAINSQQQTFANKDMAKNIAWLNNSVDTLSQWSQKLQTGVDQANQDIFGQVEGIFADLFALFAGFSPTGINVGDLQYVLQGIGALFGINPGTPFPLNLFDASMHMFSTYIVPSAQFADVIFDAIEAWMREFGLDDEAIQTLEDLKDAVSGLTSSFGDLFGAIQQLVDAFGPDLDALLGLVSSLFDLFGGIDFGALKPILELLIELGIPFINALTAIVNGAHAFLSPLSFISGSQIKTLGTNFLPPVSNATTAWTVGSNDTAAFVYDDVNDAFETVGTGIAKNVVTQTIYPANPGAVMVFNGQSKWFQIPQNNTGAGVLIQWMSNNVVSSSVKIGIPLAHSASQNTFVDLDTQTITVPQNVDGVRVGAYIDASITAGQVWVKGLSAQLQGMIEQNLISGLVSTLEGLLPTNIFSSFIEGGEATFENIQNFLGGLLNGNSPISALNLTNVEDWVTNVLNPSGWLNVSNWGDLFSNLTGFISGNPLQDLTSLLQGGLFGQIGADRISSVSVSSIGDDSPNFLANPGFDSSIAIVDPLGKWSVDTSNGHSGNGCASIVADGQNHTIDSDPMDVAQNQTVPLSVWTQWINTVAPTNCNGIQLNVSKYLANDTGALNYLGTETTAFIATPNGSSSNAPENDFVQILGSYTVPAGVSHITTQLKVTSDIASGTVKFDDGSTKKTGLMPLNFVDGLPTSLGDLGGKFQGILDTVINNFLPGSGDGLGLDILDIALQFIPGANVTGAGGISSITDTITTMWDTITSALRFLPMSGVGLSELADAAQNTATNAVDANTLATNQQNILGNRTNNPVIGMLERTTFSNMPLTALGTSSTPLNFAVTQAVSSIALIRMPNTDTKGIVYFRSSGASNISGFYLNFGTMDLAGNITPLFSSSNLVGQLTSGWQWQMYTFPGSDKITHNASQVLVVEFQIVGSGTLLVAGVPLSWMTDGHPTATTQMPAATRNTGSTNAAASLSISAGSVVFTGNTPLVGLGRSDVPPDYIPEQRDSYSTSGTWTRPGWMKTGDIIDIFLVAAGGGGQSGGYGATGKGGGAGEFLAQSYVLDSDINSTGLPVIPMSTTVFTHSLGAPGTGGQNPFLLAPGFAALDSSVSATGMTTMVADGGQGGGRGAGDSPGTFGVGPGDKTIGNFTAKGGTNVGSNSDGSFPGGGGGAGYPAVGRPGGHAKVWYGARQAVVV